VCFNKADVQSENIQLLAWNRLIQRFDAFLKRKENAKGFIISDDTNSMVLNKLVRKMRVENPVISHFVGTGYHLPTNNIIEDIFERRSLDSYFIQTVDVIAHCLYRMEHPKGSLRKFGVHHFFTNLEPVLLKEASRNDELGIVRK
jgi:hypothetical protein